VRAPAFGYDNTKAQVFVHVEGTLGAVTIAAAHDATQAWSGTAWAAGSTGINVLFPNVDPTAGTTTVSATGATGGGTIPLAANSFTYVTVVFP